MKKYFTSIIAVMVFMSCLGPNVDPRVVSTDIPNFWRAYDKIITTEDSVLQYRYLDSIFFQNGTEGLAGIREARGYTPRDYLTAINRYPKFWASIRENTLRADELSAELDEGIDQLRSIYPSLRPAKIYFTVGALRTGGTTLDSLVLIGSEISLADSTTVTSEFPKSLAHLTDHFATNPNEHLIFLNVHEYVHTQQKSRVNNLLSMAIYEGVAEFVAVKALDIPSPNPPIAFGKQNPDRIRKVFEHEMFYPNNMGKWLYGSTPNEFGMRDLGYYVGYQICENYYNQAADKTKAIEELIELDYTNEDQVETFIKGANYFSAPLDDLFANFERKRPTVTSITQFENQDQAVDPDTKEVTINFSQPLNGYNTGVDFGDLGELAFPKGTVDGRRWAEDATSWTMPVVLEPNKQYQIFISNNFRTGESIPLKPYLIEFKTAGE